MPTKRLTDLSVQKLKSAPAGKRVEHFDLQQPGLSLRVTDRGRKSWSVYYYLGNKHLRLTLGRYPDIDLAEARRKADDVHRAARKGHDPRVEKKRAKARSMTFGDLAEAYIERYAKVRKRSWGEDKRNLENDVLPHWRHRSAHGITRADVREVVDGVVSRGAPVHANNVLAVVRKLFNWAVETDQLPASPAAGLRPVTAVKARDRVLTDREIRVVWVAADRLGYPFGVMVQLLLLTGQRRDEVAGMRWTELDPATKLWEIPRERAKSDRANVVPLSDAAVALIDRVPEMGEFVLTTTGERPVSGFSKAKRRLDVEILRLLRKDAAEGGADSEKVALSDWRLHDLRRTVATGMAGLNVPPHIVEKVLNHQTGMISGVAAVYNRFGYVEEKRAALTAWAERLDTIVAGNRGAAPEPNVESGALAPAPQSGSGNAASAETVRGGFKEVP